MSEVQTRNSLPQLLVESGLMDVDEVRRVVKQHRDRAGSPAEFADCLVETGHLTSWQAGKLLQGKHLGFQLGPYVLLRHLAKGGMSSLYVARHRQTGDVCALKVLPPAKAEQSDASYLSRFLREAALTCRLRHPNVIRVDEVLSTEDEVSGVYFMSMELLEGSDLFNKVSRSGPLPVRSAVEIIRQAALGLEYAHSQGLIHRDVKPGNVYETTDGTVKILDLGLAGLEEDSYEENLTRNYNERVLGTADYLAPEQAVDSHRADSRADIYALGCTFYFILTGRPPFVDGTLPQRILAHQTRQPRSVSSLRSDVPDEILDLLNQMLVKKRADRIQTAGEVATRLQAALDHMRDDQSFDQPAQMLAGSGPLSGRPLQRIQPSQKQNSESPTDSIRASETQTAPSVPQMESAQKTSQDDLADSPRYSPEFHSFLAELDRRQRLDSVMDAEFRESQLRSMSFIRESEVEVNGCSQDHGGSADAVMQNSHSKIGRFIDVPPERRRASESVGLRTELVHSVLVFVAAVVLLIASTSFLPFLRSLFGQLFLSNGA